MNKRIMLGVCCLLAQIAVCAGTESDLFRCANRIKLKGYLGERLDSMLERHVCRCDVDYITEPFFEKTERQNRWQTEFWGKYMHSAVPYSLYADLPCLLANIERSVSRILGSQEPSGYIGNYPDELRCGEGWDVWGMKYTLLGLIHYYDLLGSETVRNLDVGRRRDQVLSAAKRLCDFVIGEIGPKGRRGCELWQTGNWSGYASSSILEPVVWLYRRTKDQKYLDFAAYIVKGMMEAEEGPRLVDLALKGVSVADRNGYGNKADEHGGYVSKHNRRKAYEMMSCYQGLLDYVELLRMGSRGGKEELERIRNATIMTGEDIAKEEINLAGGGSCAEVWFHGARKQYHPHVYLQETCVTTTWMRFCQKLLNETGDSKWADEMERSFYNAYLGALRSDGAEFACYTPLAGSRYSGRQHCDMHMNCCMANGPRGFLCFLDEFCRQTATMTTFNFYGSAQVKGFEMYSLYPRQDWVRIVSHTTGQLVVRLRIPAWSAKTTVKLNGCELSGVAAGSYFPIERAWSLGDIVEVKFDMPVVAHKVEHHIAFTRGPVLLARDSRFSDGNLMETFRAGCIADGQTMAGFEAVRTPDDKFWMAYSATLPLGGHHENPEGKNLSTVFFCDYASAGNAWCSDNQYRCWFEEELGPND